jgi:hypothetical protein
MKDRIEDRIREYKYIEGIIDELILERQKERAVRNKAIRVRAYISDLSYYIDKKEEYLEFIKNDKNKSALQREIGCLKVVKTLIKDMSTELIQTQADLDVLIERRKFEKYQLRILQGLECAFNHYSLTGEKTDIPFLLSMLLNNPEYYIQKWADQIIFWKQQGKELDVIMDNFSYYEPKYQEVFIGICRTSGFDENKKLAVWKRKTDNRNKKKK